MENVKIAYCISTKCPHKWICGKNYFTLINLGEVIDEIVPLTDMYHQNMVCEKFIKLWGDYGIWNDG